MQGFFKKIIKRKAAAKYPKMATNSQNSPFIVLSFQKIKFGYFAVVLGFESLGFKFGVC